MSQRYFLTTESAYEALRLALDAELGFPKDSGTSIFTPALEAPRDSLRRIVLAVDDALPYYTEIIAKVAPLLSSASAQELTEAEYLAFLVCVTESGGSATFTTVTDTLTYTNFLPEGGDLATALSGIDSALTGKAAAAHASQHAADGSDEVVGLLSRWHGKYSQSYSESTGYPLNAIVEHEGSLYLHTNAGPDGNAPGDASWPLLAGYGIAAALHAHSAADVTFAATDRLLGRSSSGAGAGQEITCTAAGRAILDDATAADQRTTLSAQKTITSGTAAPTGGSDGDIYLQYT